MGSALVDNSKRSAALLGSKSRAEIIRVLLTTSKLSISELARRTHLGKSSIKSAFPGLEEAGLITVTEVGREHQAELVASQRSLAESIVALDAPMLPVLQEKMTDDDLERVALYFATPSSVQARDDDWHDDQRALPVSSIAWESRGELD